MKQIAKYKTFDAQFLDQYNNNILIYSILFDNAYAFTEIVNEHPKALEHVNNKKEDSIIIATKLGFLDKVKSYTIRNANFNHQDELGNTALLYAVNMRNICVINLLAHFHVDPDLKNNQGMSPKDVAKQIGEEKLIKYMEKPRPIHEMKEKLEKSKSKGLFKSKNSFFDKTDDYIKNYQINNFKEEYKTIIENYNNKSFTYNSEIRGYDEQFGLVIYVMLDRFEVYSINNVNPLNTIMYERLVKCGSENVVYSIPMLTSKPLEETTNIDELFSYGEPNVNKLYFIKKLVSNSIGDYSLEYEFEKKNINPYH